MPVIGNYVYHSLDNLSGLSLCPKRAEGVKLGMEKPDEAKREVTNERTTETDKPTAICC